MSIRAESVRGWSVCWCGVAVAAVGLAFAFPAAIADAAEPRLNVLLITVDDMSCDSVGAFGCELEATTPCIDGLAARSQRFEHAHVQTGSCFPSRNVLLSGSYSHNTGVEGFYQVPEASHPHLVDVMKEAGYFVGIRGKVQHSTPYHPYGWDADLTVLDGQQQALKDPSSYGRSTRRGIAMARAAGKPFCLTINVSDPHKPFYGVNGKGEPVADPYRPSRVFSADEVPVPGFLFDHPAVRKELALYYSSVRRADDCVGEILAALAESGEEDRTLIVFLSDHGMPLPFAKTAVWLHSTRTPLIIRWPGVTRAGEVYRDHMVSAVVVMPTILEATGIAPPKGFDGRSFAPLLRGEPQAGRNIVFTFHNENSGRNRSPMRSVQTKRYGYIFNPWSDGTRVFRTATTGTATYRTMKQLAAGDAAMAARLDLFEHRVPEELYDYEHDPDALHNLIDDPAVADVLAKLRGEMRRIMVESGDPLLEVFDRRDEAGFVGAAIDRLQAEADARGGKKRKGPQPGQPQRAAEATVGRFGPRGAERRGQVFQSRLRLYHPGLDRIPFGNPASLF